MGLRLIKPNDKKNIVWGIAGAIALATSGCGANQQVYQKTQEWLSWHPALSKNQERNVLFEFEVTPVGEQGLYELTGKTELPEGSQLAIAALRYLKLDPAVTRSNLVLEANQQTEQIEGELFPGDLIRGDLNVAEVSAIEVSTLSDDLSADVADETDSPQVAGRSLRKRRLALKPSYAILDYQPVTVRDGQWQTQLNLWQVAKDGRYQESWQLHQEELKIEWDAEPEVIFLSTLLIDGAADRLQALQNELAERQLTLSRSLIQTSIWGEQYFQATQLLEIDLPQATTTPPPTRVQDINGGWGRRYLLVEQDPLPATLEFPPDRSTNDPGSPQEFIQ